MNVRARSLSRRLRALTMLETIMVLVVFGLIIVAAITAGQRLLSGQTADVAVTELRQLVSAVEDATRGTKNFENITSARVAPFVPDSMRGGTTDQIFISNGSFPVIVRPGIAAEVHTILGSRQFAGAINPRLNYAIQIGDTATPIRGIELCSALLTAFTASDDNFLGVLLQNDTNAATAWISARRYGGVTRTAWPTGITNTVGVNNLVLAERDVTEWPLACEVLAADVEGAVITLAFR